MKITSSYVVSVTGSTVCCSSANSDTVTLFEGFNENSIALKFEPESIETLSILIEQLKLTLAHLTNAKIEELERMKKLHRTCCKDSYCAETLGF
ncbi:MAG: hypothetical protein ACRC62_11655 [Microcoleus sp.]